MTTTESKQDLILMAHFLRRAGFGATQDEMDHALEIGYDQILDELLNPEVTDTLSILANILFVMRISSPLKYRSSKSLFLYI